ncbi:nitrilase-related carbon-nitrogen hydrolase [Geminicoccus flavidas]|uniref:nitrilase-related carbon-nitrogen hydrolase n=1 Tax=Geminicoccus flavidas TaxID=2506407 RepID=UPI00135ABB79|nr:nitrilase-related carbon-nitrogen hydrolase [Geminicoccus flavidas]
MSDLVLAIAQFDPVPGDVAANFQTIRRLRGAAEEAQLLLCPDLALAGLPVPANEAGLSARVADALLALQADTADGGPAVLVGLPLRPEDGGRPGLASVLLGQGRELGRRWRVQLDSDPRLAETGRFGLGELAGPLALPCPDGPPWRLGVLAGAELDLPEVAEALAESGTEILLVPAALPFVPGGFERRQQHAVQRVTETGLPLVLANAAGGGGELVFDGLSLALDGARRLVALAPAFRESLLPTRWAREDDGSLTPVETSLRVPPPEEPADLYLALLAGLRGLTGRLGLELVLLDLGTAGRLLPVLAVDALGPGRVRGWTAGTDGNGLADALGIRTERINAGLVQATLGQLLESYGTGSVPIVPVHDLIGTALAARLGALLLSGLDRTALAGGAAASGYAPLGELAEPVIEALLRWRAAQRPDGALGPEPAALAAALAEPGAAAADQAVPRSWWQARGGAGAAPLILRVAHGSSTADGLGRPTHAGL